MEGCANLAVKSKPSAPVLPRRQHPDDRPKAGCQRNLFTAAECASESYISFNIFERLTYVYVGNFNAVTELHMCSRCSHCRLSTPRTSLPRTDANGKAALFSNASNQVVIISALTPIDPDYKLRPSPRFTPTCLHIM